MFDLVYYDMIGNENVVSSVALLLHKVPVIWLLTLSENKRLICKNRFLIINQRGQFILVNKWIYSWSNSYG